MISSLSGLLRWTLSLFLAACVAALAPAQRLVCRIVPGADPAQIARDHSLYLRDITAPAPFILVEPDPFSGIEFSLARLMADPRVVWVEDDDDLVCPENTSGGRGGTVAAVADRNALYAVNANLLQQIRWSVPPPGAIERDVRVAILDNGLSPLHGRLWKKVAAAANLLPDGRDPYDLPYGVDSNGNFDPDEMVGHGTMIAGIIDFMAPEAQFVIARVADSDGQATAWSIIKGLAFAVLNGAEVANISLGSVDRIPALSDVLDWTDENGLLIVAPIGNNGQRLAVFPAGYSEALCVSGVLPDDRKAPFSNWRGTADSAAPATGIRSTFWNGQMGLWSGTSFAAPLVAGAVADCLTRRLSMRPEDLIDAVDETGDDIDGLNPLYRGELGTRLNYSRLAAFLRQ